MSDVIQISKNLAVVTCRVCGKAFETRPHPKYGTFPKTCPSCRQSLPTHKLLNRERIGEWQGVLIKSLPGRWEEFTADKPNAAGRYKIDIRGRAFGASWHGRIVIWADQPFGPGDVVDVVWLRAEYKVRLKAISRQSIGAALNEGLSVSYTTHIHLPLDYEPEPDENVFDSTETHEYLVLYPSSVSEPKLKMGYLSAIQKWNRDDRLVIPPRAELVLKVSGTSRSGRHSGQGALVIMPLDAEAKSVHVHDKGALHKGDLIAMHQNPAMAEVILSRKAGKPIEEWVDEV